MDKKTIDKMQYLLAQTRVMTLCVTKDDLPWATPVYFSFKDNVFFFLSNPMSQHIQFAQDQKKVAASIFQDSDSMEEIFGIQMSGSIKKISNMATYLKSIKYYVNKFDFLSKAFGREILENPDFFLEKFKSELYGFYPETIFLSDNSRTTDKRIMIDLDIVQNTLKQ